MTALPAGSCSWRAETGPKAPRTAPHRCPASPGLQRLGKLVEPDYDRPLLECDENGDERCAGCQWAQRLPDGGAEGLPRIRRTHRVAEPGRGGEQVARRDGRKARVDAAVDLSRQGERAAAGH